MRNKEYVNLNQWIAWRLSVNCFANSVCSILILFFKILTELRVELHKPPLKKELKGLRDGLFKPDV